MAEQTRITRRGVVGAFAALGAIGIAPRASLAQTFPTGPLRIVVGFAAGGLADGVARMLAPFMSEHLGQQIVVENRTGAAGNLAMGQVATGPADGHTLLCSSTSQITVSPNTYKSLPADPVNDLAHVSMICEGDLIVSASAGLGASNLKEFIEIAQRAPGSVAYGSSGAGGNLHLALELFAMRAGVKLKPVHYRGTGLLIPDFITNQIQVSINAFPIIETYVQQGLLKPLVTVGANRESELPNVPTATELGLADLGNCTNWFGLHVAKRTPQPVVDRLRQALLTALASADFQKRLAASALRPVGNTQEAFMRRIAADNRINKEVAQAANIIIE